MFQQPLLRVVLVERSPTVRRALRSLLTAEPGTAVMAEAGLPEQAVELCRGREPDAIVLSLSVMDGAPEVVRLLRRLCPSASLVAYGLVDTPVDVSALLRAGLHRYIPQDRVRHDLVAALRDRVPEKGDGGD